MAPTDPCSILLLSVGTRNKVVQYFRRSFQGQGRVIATDMSPLAPALYEADAHYVVPAMADPGYLQVIFDICRKEQVRGVLSLIDPELSLLAAHQAEFAALGTTVIGSSYDLCELALDKYQMYQWLQGHGYRCAASWMDTEAFFAAEAAGKVHYPVFVKPARGSASLSISIAEDGETVRLLQAHQEGLMIQEYLHGTEIGADVYIDLISHEIVSIFTKEKLKMRAGETDKAVSFIDPALNQLITRFVREAGYLGQIDIDLFRVDGEYYISEVNPRFGGGYPHAWAAGCDHTALILRNLQGQANQPKIGCYPEGLYMMKYNEIKILGPDEGAAHA